MWPYNYCYSRAWQDLNHCWPEFYQAEGGECIRVFSESMVGWTEEQTRSHFRLCADLWPLLQLCRFVVEYVIACHCDCRLCQWYISQWNGVTAVLLMTPLASPASQQSVSWKHSRLVHMWGWFLTDVFLWTASMCCWLPHTVNCGRFCFWCCRSVFFVCVWNILGIAERIYEFEGIGQRSRSQGTKNGIFRPFWRPGLVYVW